MEKYMVNKYIGDGEYYKFTTDSADVAMDAFMNADIAQLFVNRNGQYVLVDER